MEDEMPMILSLLPMMKKQLLGLTCRVKVQTEASPVSILL